MVRLVQSTRTTTATTSSWVSAAAVPRAACAAVVGGTTAATTPTTPKATPTTIGSSATRHQLRHNHSSSTTTTTSTTTAPSKQNPNRLTAAYSVMQLQCPQAIAAYSACIQANNANDLLLKNTCQQEFAAVRDCFRQARSATTTSRHL